MTEQMIKDIINKGVESKSTDKLGILLIYILHESKKIKNLKITWKEMGYVEVPEVEIEFYEK